MIELALSIIVAVHPHAASELREYEPHEPVILETTLQIPEGWSPRYSWDIREPAQLLSGPHPGIAHIWAPPGEYTAALEIVLARVKEGTSNEIEWASLEERFYLLIRGQPPPVKPEPEPDPEPTPRQPTQATYVYESELQVVPRPIQAVLKTANSRGIQATAIDQHSRNASGQIPEQYRRALGAGRSVPYFVAEDDRGIIAVLDNPTAQQIAEALKVPHG